MSKLGGMDPRPVGVVPGAVPVWAEAVGAVPAGAAPVGVGEVEASAPGAVLAWFGVAGGALAVEPVAPGAEGPNVCTTNMPMLTAAASASAASTRLRTRVAR